MELLLIQCCFFVETKLFLFFNYVIVYHSILTFYLCLCHVCEDDIRTKIVGSRFRLCAYRRSSGCLYWLSYAWVNTLGHQVVSGQAVSSCFIYVFGPLAVVLCVLVCFSVRFIDKSSKFYVISKHFCILEMKDNFFFRTDAYVHSYRLCRNV